MNKKSFTTKYYVCILFTILWMCSISLSSSAFESANRSNEEIKEYYKPNIFHWIRATKPDSVIKGFIGDGTGKPIIGASVYILGKINGAITDHDGHFILADVHINDSLLVTSLNFEPQRVIVDQIKYFNITLQPSSNLLGEVSVISNGYVLIPKERSTGSFVQIDNDLLNRRVSPDMISRLEDISSGLSFDKRIGGEPRLSIRGRSTIFANDQPLVVIDNFPYDGDLDNINPNDIENVTILRDAAAASIWGVRAGNGVIVITTKKGKRNQPLQLTLNSNLTLGEKPNIFIDPSFLNSTDFIEVQKSLYAQGFYQSWIDNQNLQPLSPVVEILEKAKADGLGNAEIDLKLAPLRGNDIRNDVSKYLYRRSITEQYALNLRGGSDKTTYFFSSGYDRGISGQVGNKSDRLTINSQLNFYPVDNLELSSNMVYNRTTDINNGIGYKDLDIGTKSIYPYARLADDQDRHLSIEQTYRNSFKNEMVPKGLLDWNYRPLNEISMNDNSLNSSEFRVNSGLKFTFLNDFSVELRYQYMTGLTSGKNLHTQDSYFARNLINRYTEITEEGLMRNIPLGAIKNTVSSDHVSQTGRFQLNYNNTWGNRHDIYALAGFEAKQLTTGSNSRTIYGFDEDVLTAASMNYNQLYNTLPTGSSMVPDGLSQRETLDRYRSFFANTAYTYLDKYTVSGSARIDQSNFFGVRANQKSVPLWSAGLAWDISDELFFGKNSISFLKLRASYGFNGNLDKTVTAFITAGYLRDPYNTATMALIRNAPNPDLRWEKIGIFNLAVDFATKNNTLSGSIEYYSKKGKDMLGFTSLEPTTGLFNTQTHNYGYKGNFAEIEGHGLDIQLHSKNIRGRDFNWVSDILFSNTYDKVTSYDIESSAFNYLTYGPGLLSGAMNISPSEGYPVFGIYAYKWAGLDPETGDPIGYFDGQTSKDYNAIANKSSFQDLKFIGRALPTTFGALRNAFFYRDFSISINISYKFGYYFRRMGLSYSGLYNNWNGHQEFSERWVNPGDEARTAVPSMPLATANMIANRDNFYLRSEPLVEKGDHIRLQDIQLSYTLSKGKAPWLVVENVQVYLYMNNLGILWRANHHGLDPDYSTAYTYPPSKTIAIGIKANF